MKFKHSMKSRATLKKQSVYEYGLDDGITENIIKKAKRHTPQNPLFIHGKYFDFKMYQHKDKLRLVMFHSFDSFVEI